MLANNLKILLIEDSVFEARIINDKLKKVFSPEDFTLIHVKNLAEAIDAINADSFDVVLLDLILPDSQGVETFQRIKERAKDVPYVVFTGVNDDNVAAKAMQEGAQDYLIKHQVTGELLIRSIRHAIERHRILTELRNKALIDDLTGLYNRRGFFTFVEQQIKIADRTNRGFLLIYADVDKLKWINDNLGHNAGDSAILDVANILREVFRDADIIARIGGDEFVIIAVDATEESIKPIKKRLQKKVDYYNKNIKSPYNLSISIGTAFYDPNFPCTVDILINRADKKMYEEKTIKAETC